MLKKLHAGPQFLCPTPLWQYITTLLPKCHFWTIVYKFTGSGKSALVANWVGRVEDREPETFVFVHFIGSSAESASYLKMLRRYKLILVHAYAPLELHTSQNTLLHLVNICLINIYILCFHYLSGNQSEIFNVFRFSIVFNSVHV